MKNKLIKEEIDAIAQKIINPFTDNLKVETDENGKQWAHNLEKDKSTTEKFEVRYDEDEEKLKDGIYSAAIFVEGIIAANFVPDGAPIPMQKHYQFVILKNKKGIR